MCANLAKKALEDNIYRKAYNENFYVKLFI